MVSTYLAYLAIQRGATALLESNTAKMTYRRNAITKPDNAKVLFAISFDGKITNPMIATQNSVLGNDTILYFFWMLKKLYSALEVSSLNSL